MLSPVNVYEETARARIEAAQTPHGVDAQLAGEVANVMVAVGADVEAGDVLIEFNAVREELRLREEFARRESSASRAEHLRREIEARQKAAASDREASDAAAEVARQHGAETAAELELARSTKARIEQLASNGRTPQIEVPKAAAEARKLAATQEAWRFEIQRLRHDAAMRALQFQAEIEELRRDLAALEGEHTASDAIITQLENEIDRHRVRAPIRGRVGDVVPLPVGAHVAEGQRLATIVPDGGLTVVADFSPQAAMGRIRPGQPARLRVDAFPWAQFGTVTATVTSVAGEIRDGVARVQMRLDRAEVPGIPLQHGLPGTVEVLVERTSPAMLVLQSAGLLLAGNRTDGPPQGPVTR
jgi:multidrug resistance efflux pump